MLKKEVNGQWPIGLEIKKEIRRRISYKPVSKRSIVNLHYEDGYFTTQEGNYSDDHWLLVKEFLDEKTIKRITSGFKFENRSPSEKGVWPKEEDLQLAEYAFTYKTMDKKNFHKAILVGLENHKYVIVNEEHFQGMNAALKNNKDVQWFIAKEPDRHVRMPVVVKVNGKNAGLLATVSKEALSYLEKVVIDEIVREFVAKKLKRRRQYYLYGS